MYSDHQDQTPSPPQVASDRGVAPPRDGPAWEWRGRLGITRAMVMTIREVLTRTRQAFAHLRWTGAGPAIGFLLFIEMTFGLGEFCIGYPVSLRAHEIFVESSKSFDISSLPPEIRDMASEIMARMTAAPAPFANQLMKWIILHPIAILLGLLFITIITHVPLLVLRAGRGGFTATLRATAYSYGACSAFGFLPVVGTFMRLIVWPILYIIALAETHEAPAWRATVVVMLPGLILIAFLLAAMLVMVKTLGIGGLPVDSSF